MIVPKAPEVIAHLGSFVLTNTIFTSTVISIFIIIVIIVASKKFKEIPGRFQNFIEYIIDFTRTTILEQTQGDKERLNIFFPWVTGLFIFILINNIEEIFPFLGFVPLTIRNAGNTVPLFRSPSSDLNSTIALTLISVIATQYFAFQRLGAKEHLKRYFNFTKPINIFSGLFEIISEFTKVISLSFRLYGNIYAGDIILLLFIKTGGQYFLPLPFLAFEIVVDIVQAAIFAMLTLSFMAIETDIHEEF